MAHDLCNYPLTAQQRHEIREIINELEISGYSTSDEQLRSFVEEYYLSGEDKRSEAIAELVARTGLSWKDAELKLNSKDSLPLHELDSPKRRTRSKS